MAIERNICGHEMGDVNEFNYQLVIPAAHGLNATSPRTGAYCFRTNPGTLSGSGFFSFFPVGSVIGTTGTVSSGNKKRARARVYVRIVSQTWGVGPASQEHVFGFGGDTGTCGVWIDGNRNFGVKVTSGTTTLSVGTLALNTWYAFTLDVLLDVSANTLVTATLTVTDDRDVPTFSETVQATGNIGASDTLDALGVGEVRQSIFGIGGSYDFDDWVYMGTSDADAVSPITLPTDTHIAIVPPTGVATNQWETGTYANVDEYPVNTADTMSSVLGSGTEVEFSHASGLQLGFGDVQAIKLYVNSKVASGTGSVDMMLNGVAKSVTLTSNYPGNASSNPNGGVAFGTWTAKQFSNILYGVKKQNGTQQTFIANIGMEALYSPAAYGAGNQIRGETQIKKGSIYDAQIADAAQIARSKIRGLGDSPAPIFFPEEYAGDDWLIPGPPGPSGATLLRVPATPVFFPEDQEDVMPVAAGSAQQSSGGGSGTTNNYYYGGGLVLLKEKVASASATIDFTTEITAQFDEYVIELLGIVPATDNTDFLMRCSTDGGATFDSGTNYGRAVRVDFASFNAVSGANSGLTSIAWVSNLDTTVAQGSMSGVIRSYLPLSTSLYKIFTAQGSYHNNDTNYYSFVGEGRYLSATAVNALRFVMSSGNIASGIFRMYGVSKTPALAAPGGGTILLATQTVSGVATVDFVNRNVGDMTGAIFQGDYDEYLFEAVGVLPATNGAMFCYRMSTDGGATYAAGASDYKVGARYDGSHIAGGSGGGVAALAKIIGTLNSSTSGGMNGTMRVYNPLSTSLHKMVLFGGGFFCNDSNYYHIHGNGTYVNTAAVNAIRFLMDSGNMSGTIRCYGVVKDAAVASGKIVQVKNTQTGAVATGTTTIPHDDTIPQSTEGDQYMSLAITPTSATSKLRIDVTVYLSHSVASEWATAALFQDSTANALAAGTSFNATGTAIQCITFTHYMTAGATSATTFKVRGGHDVAGTTTFNGQSGARVLGGVLASSITITEIIP